MSLSRLKSATSQVLNVSSLQLPAPILKRGLSGLHGRDLGQKTPKIHTGGIDKLEAAHNY